MAEGLVTILANPACPHCVHATDALTDWCREEGVAVAGIDLLHHPEAATRHRVEQSPSIVYERPDGARRVFAGFPSHDEFVRMMRP